jgi:hypothetical protein
MAFNPANWSQHIGLQNVVTQKKLVPMLKIARSGSARTVCGALKVENHLTFQETVIDKGHYTPLCGQANETRLLLCMESFRKDCILQQLHPLAPFLLAHFSQPTKVSGVQIDRQIMKLKTNWLCEKRPINSRGK